MLARMQAPLFSLGRIVATPGALARLPEHRVRQILNFHQHGDWGEVGPEDAYENNYAVQRRLRILSVYRIDPDLPYEGDNRAWIITEADRSVTTILLPEEY